MDSGTPAQCILFCSNVSFTFSEVTSNDIRKFQLWCNESVFNRFILFCQRAANTINPFECDEESVAEFLKDCITQLNGNSTIFPRSPLLREIVVTIESYQKTTWDNSYGDTSDGALLNSKRVSEMLAVAASVDLGVDTLLGTLSDRDLVLQLTPACKYLKYVEDNDPTSFWNEKCVNFLFNQVFRKSEGRMSAPEAAQILGVSVEMFFAHKSKINRPPVSKFLLFSSID